MSEGYNLGAAQSELPKPAPAVFISYCNEDKPVADSVCAALESSNINCWIAPRDVQGGRPYSGQITQAIREASILLLILTKASNRSKHVLREVERAAHCQNHLLTFRVEPIAPGDDLAYFLGADQWVDGFRPLPPSQHFPVLVQHTQRLLKRSNEERQPEQKPDATPETFAHFKILRHPDGSLFKLGKGGMGITYKAIDTILNRPVALKVIAAEQLNNQKAKHRFLREAQSAALIHHPHVATIFQFEEEGDAYFYAMEFVEGEDLERYVARRGPLSPATVLRVTLQVAQALEAAQALGLIHRDVKPANIMAVANRAGTIDIKLIDFGLAKGAGAETLDASRVTRTQDFVGSPAFASPEQCESKKLDIRSDIYSLGVSIWYLLSGKRPFVGTVGEVMVAQIIKPPPFDQLAQTPEPVVALLRRMLEKKPEDRFQTPEELQEAVENASKQLSEQFDSVPDRIVPQLSPDESSPSSVDAEQLEPVVLRTLGSQGLDVYLAVEIGALLSNRYRLVAEEREGNGGRLFQTRDEQAGPGQSPEVAVKLLHPGIARNPELLNLVENELEVIRQRAHPRLIGYSQLRRDAIAPYLVREWVHGFLLYDLLRWRRALRAAELPVLLDSLAGTLDFVANQGFGLVDVSVRKVVIGCPADVDDFESLAKGDAQEWTRCTLKLNPLSLAPLLFKSRNGWDLQTIVPASRVLSMTQAEAGIRGTKAVRLFGRLVCELLSGTAPSRAGAVNYAPLPELNQRGNETLRRACAAKGLAEEFGSCQEFWSALKEELATDFQGNRPSTPISTSIAPAPLAPSPKQTRKPSLVVAAIVAGLALISLLVIGVILFGSWGTSSQRKTSVVTPTPTPSPTPSPTLSPTLSPTPTPDAAFYNSRGWDFYQKKDYDKAISDYNEAIRLDPNLAVAYNNRGLAYDAKKDYDMAISDYNKTISLLPNSAVAYDNRGLAYDDKKDYDKAISDYNKAISLDPNFVRVYNDRGVDYYYKKDYHKAISDFNEAMMLDPKFAVAYNNRGNAYDAEKDYDKAISDYNEAIRLDPNYAQAYDNRGLAYADKKDYDKAISDYNEAIRLDPNYVRVYNDRGAAYHAKKDYDKAISDYNEAIRLDPNYAAAYHNRGSAYSYKDDYDKAISDYNEAIRLDPNDAQAYNDRGNAYYAKEDYDKAISDYNEAIRLDPTYALVYCNRGNAYYVKEDYDKAISEYNEAIRLDPNYVIAFNDRGNVYYAKKDYDKAISDYSKAIRLDPNYAQAYNQRARAFNAQGKKTQARADFDKARKLGYTGTGTQ